MAGKPESLEALFKSKAKKKPKATNFNAAMEKPAPPPPRSVRLVANTSSETDGSSAADGWERALRRDQELLKTCGLWIKEVEADGACLFRAFADQLSGDGGEAHASFREKCVDFMEANRDEFEPFLEEDFNQYCARMREPSTWGGHVEVQALARSVGVNALIYRPTEAGKPDGLSGSTVEVITSDAADTRCLQLSFHPTHHAGQHYNSVRCAGDEGTEPAPQTSVTELRRRIAEALAPKEQPKADEVEGTSSAPAHPKQKGKVFF